MHENSVKEEALRALQDYNMAFEQQDIEGQVNFYSAVESRYGRSGSAQSPSSRHARKERARGQTFCAG